MARHGGDCEKLRKLGDMACRADAVENEACGSYFIGAARVCYK